MLRSILSLLLAVVLAGSFVERAVAQEAKPDLETALFTMNLETFFPGETKKGGIEGKRLNVYIIRRGGKWASALATPTNAGKPVWNTAILPVDPANLKVEGGRISGQVSVTLVPDPWVPKDQKLRQATVTIDAAIVAKPAGEEGAGIVGEWKSSIPGEPAELEAAVLRGSGAGKITGGTRTPPEHDLGDVSYDLAFYNLIPGKTSEQFQRRRSISIGVKEGKAISARFGMMDMRHAAYDYETFDTPEQFTVSGDQFGGSIQFPADTLDGDRAEFTLTIEGRRVHNFVCGTWKGTYALDGQTPKAVSGFFRGDVRRPAFVSAMAKDDRPWFTTDKAVKPFEPGEHPRLFFRKSDLPELKRRAATPEGQQIVKRLRELLNGSDGESMPTQFNPAKQAYEKNNFKAKTGA